MQRAVTAVCFLFLFSCFIMSGCNRQEPAPRVHQEGSSPAASGPAAASGESLFRQYCSSCHPDGGNVSDPERTLHGAALRKNHITTADDIVRIMRNPISRMIRFDQATLSDRDARIIAEYILATFK